MIPRKINKEKIRIEERQSGTEYLRFLRGSEPNKYRYRDYASDKSLSKDKESVNCSSRKSTLLFCSSYNFVERNK